MCISNSEDIKNGVKYQFRILFSIYALLYLTVRFVSSFFVVLLKIAVSDFLAEVLSA